MDIERFKPEWRIFEARFRANMRDQLEKLDGLPDHVRIGTEDQIRGRYLRHEIEITKLEEKEPDFYNPKTQGKHMSLVELVHFDADQIATKAVKFENWFQDQARDTLKKIDGLPPAVRMQTEDRLRDRYQRFENERAALAEKEPDFDNPSTQAKHMSLLGSLNAETEDIANKAVEAHREKDKPQEDLYYAGAHRSGEIVLSQGPHPVPGTMTLHNGGLPLDQLRALIVEQAEHRDGRPFVPGFAQEGSDLDAMKAVAMFNSRLHEAHDPQGAKELYAHVTATGTQTRTEDLNPHQKWETMAHKNEQRAKELAEQFKAREAAAGHDRDRER